MTRKRKQVADPTTAVAYVRVSTSEQNHGPNAQRDAIAAWAERSGARVVAWHLDLGVSGAMELDRRPGLSAALASLKDCGAGILVVAKRDRVARDVVVAAMVERLAERVGARLVSAAGEGDEDSPTGQLMRRIIDSFSEYERAIIRQRTRQALAAKRARGERVGRIPFGFRLDSDRVHLVPVPHEIQAVEQMQEMRESGATLQAICDHMEAVGIKPKKGGRWWPRAVQRICERQAV